MNAEPRESGNDRRLEQDLDVLRASWAERQPAEPPELLDRAILNAARRELERQPVRRRFGQRRLRWAGALATAAIVVLALSIVVQQEPAAPPAVEGNGLRLEPSAPAAAPAAKAEQPPDLRPAAPLLDTQAAAASGNGRPESAMAPESRELREALSDVPAPPPGGLAGVEADSSSEQAAAPGTLTPEDWIEHMRTLLQAGRLEELERERAAFRATWPDYDLPPELQDR